VRNGLEVKILPANPETGKRGGEPKSGTGASRIREDVEVGGQEW
jgi:hypothetical protein